MKNYINRDEAQERLNASQPVFIERNLGGRIISDEVKPFENLIKLERILDDVYGVAENKYFTKE